MSRSRLKIVSHLCGRIRPERPSVVHFGSINRKIFIPIDCTNLRMTGVQFRCGFDTPLLRTSTSAGNRFSTGRIIYAWQEPGRANMYTNTQQQQKKQQKNKEEEAVCIIHSKAAHAQRTHTRRSNCFHLQQPSGSAPEALYCSWFYCEIKIFSVPGKRAICILWCFPL